MKPLAPNTLIQNRYLVVQLIGKGGMGDVYLAVDQRLGSAIALKRTFFSDDDALREAFEREAKMLARLRHTALTKVSDHFTEDGIQYLVMEHITGDDLNERLELNKKPFPVSWVLFWADQLLDALSYLHSHEPPIIHRDIKPQNLKLTTDNHIILLDFGLAKNTVGETRLSTTGNVIAYTPNYASMEQIRGTGTTARSDIYSLSATMYQLLTNVVPDDALSRADSVLNGLPDSIEPLSELNPEVTPAVSSVILRGMSLSSEQRYATARDMQIALREAYSQVQSAMSAQTVAFTVQEELLKADTVQPQADVRTVAFSTPITNEPVGEKTEVMPVVIPTIIEPTPLITNEVQPPLPDFNATIPFMPVGEKTEVMPVVIPTPIGEQTEVMPYDVPTPFSEKTEVLSFPVETTPPNVETDAGYPEATVANINFGDAVSEIPNQQASNFEATPLLENYEAEPISEEVVTVAPPPPLKKKAAGGGGKMFAVIGVLLALGILGLAAVGGGLYMMKPELLGLSTPTPTPAPTPELAITPSVTPSTEPTYQSETNTNPSVTPTVELTDANNGNTTTEPTKSPGVTPENKPPIDRPTTPTPGKVVTPTPQRPTPQVPKTPTPPKTTGEKTPVKPTGKPTIYQ